MPPRSCSATLRPPRLPNPPLPGAGESGADPWGVCPGFQPPLAEWDPSHAQPTRKTPPCLALDASPLLAGFIVLSPVTQRGWEGRQARGGDASGASTNPASNPENFLVCPQVQDQLVSLLEEVSAAYPVDADRVVVTGLSMGGGGTVALAAAQPGLFAAAAPVCGWGRPGAGRALKDMPLWIAHGRNDVVVDAAASQALAAEARSAGNGAVELRLLDDQPGPRGAPEMEGHDSWTATYSDPAFWQWVRRQRRHRPTAAAPSNAASDERRATR